MFGWVAAIAGWVPLSAQGEPTALGPIEVVSPAGHYRAEVRKAAGQERVADAVARWKLSVWRTDSQDAAEPLWSCRFAHREGNRIYRLSDDGAALLAVEQDYTASRPLARVWGVEGERLALTASELSVDSAGAGSRSSDWLAPQAGVELEWRETPRGPVQFARIAASDGAVRWLDLTTGDVRVSPEFREPVRVEPIAALAGVNVLAAPYVNSFECATTIHWGEVLEVRVSGSHPTPNWRNVGFDFSLGGEDGRELTVAPMSSPPPANSPQLQVLQGYHATAYVHGLAPGRYVLKLDGRGENDPEPRVIDVRPARPALEVRTAGGILGMQRSVRLYVGGVAVVESGRPARETFIEVLAPGEVSRLEDLLRAAEGEPGSKGTSVSDALEFKLTWRAGGRDHEKRVYDPGASGALGELARRLNALHR